MLRGQRSRSATSSIYSSNVNKKCNGLKNSLIPDKPTDEGDDLNSIVSDEQTTAIGSPDTGDISKNILSQRNIIHDQMLCQKQKAVHNGDFSGHEDTRGEENNISDEHPSARSLSKDQDQFKAIVDNEKINSEKNNDIGGQQNKLLDKYSSDGCLSRDQDQHRATVDDEEIIPKEKNDIGGEQNKILDEHPCAGCLCRDKGQHEAAVDDKEIIQNGETNAVEQSMNVSREYLNSRYLSQVPYQYQPDLIQFNESEECTDYHFGLIRGYHREMYDKNRPKDWFLCCSCDRETAKRIARKNRVLSWQIIGVVFGALFVFFGLTTLILSYILSSNDTREYFLNSSDIPTTYIHIVAIVGLTVLTFGSALVSLCLLVPVCIGRLRMQDFAGFWCNAGDLYIKNTEQTFNDQFLYFDAALYAKIFGNTQVKKVQPELTND